MFCYQCGTKIAKDTKYCPKCGTLLDAGIQYDGQNAGKIQESIISVECCKNGSLTLDDKTLNIEWGGIDSTSGINCGRQTMVLSDIKDIFIKNRPPYIFLFFAVIFIVSSLLEYLMAVYEDILHRIFDYSYSGLFNYIVGLFVFVGTPLFGLICLYLFLKNSKKYYITIEGAGGKMEIYLKTEELDKARKLIEKFNFYKHQ